MSDLPTTPAAPIVASGSAHPAEVPAHLDDAALARALGAGRPQGTWSTLEVDGVVCPRVQAGRGRAVLCVHGLGHDAWDWAPLFVRCSNDAALTAFDLPGFGLSTKPARAWDLEVLVQALLACARALPAPPVVVASSRGGHVALVAALRAPDAFAHLVLSAPGGLVEVPLALQAMLRAYYAVDAIVARPEAEIVGNSRRIFATPGLAASDALAARKLAVHRSSAARAFAVPFAGVVDDVFRHVVLGRLTALRVPCTFVTGEADVVVPPDAVAAAALRLGARLERWSGVGHCPHLEVPDRFADLVRSCLRDGGPHVSR